VVDYFLFGVRNGRQFFYTYVIAKLFTNYYYYWTGNRSVESALDQLIIISDDVFT